MRVAHWWRCVGIFIKDNGSKPMCPSNVLAEKNDNNIPHMKLTNCTYGQLED